MVKEKKQKSKKWIAILVIVLVLLAIGGYFAYYIFIGPSYGGSGNTRVLENPTKGLTDAEAVLAFDEDFVLYLLYAIGANELHNPPLSGNTAKIELYVGEEVFSAEVVKGVVRVSKGVIDEEDIVIRTSKIEGVKMVRSRNYIGESFDNGGSSIELVAGKTSLATKGYLNLYKSLIGNELE